MNLRHIEVFHAVYVNGSVSAAARALGVSQPSVSKVLRHAESLLGFALFERTGGRLVATEDAHVLFADAGAIQDRVQALRATGRTLRGGVGRTLRIAALPSLALSALPKAVGSFLATHPGVKFDLQTIHHDDLLRILYERDTDIAIANEVPRAVPVGSRRLGGGELYVLYREADMPDAPPELPITVLQGRPFISLTASGPLGHLFLREVQRLGLELDEVVSARTFYVAAALVREGVGMSVIDSFTARASLAPGLSVRPLAPHIEFAVNAMFLPDRPPTALANDFLKAFVSVIATP